MSTVLKARGLPERSCKRDNRDLHLAAGRKADRHDTAFTEPFLVAATLFPATINIVQMTNSTLLDGPVKVTVGVLALQGGFHEHEELLQLAAKNIEAHISLTTRFVRTPQDLESCDALIIPGGESTTITLLATKGGLMQPMRDFVESKPVWGTCAGMICLAESIYMEDGGENQKGQQHSFGGVDMNVVRNQYGRQVRFHPRYIHRGRPAEPHDRVQLASFEHPLQFQGIRDPATPFTGVFIRAPIVHHLSSDPSQKQEILATVPLDVLPTVKAGQTPLGPDAHIVALRQQNKLVSSFHPELTSDPRIHEFFLANMVIPHQKASSQ